MTVSCPRAGSGEQALGWEPYCVGLVELHAARILEDVACTPPKRGARQVAA